MAEQPGRRVLVIVPFAMSADNLLLRQAQLEGLSFGDGIRFEYRAVKAGPMNYSSHHDFVLADAANFEAGCRAQAEGFDFLDVRGVGLQGHGVESMRALNVPQTILCPVRRSANQDLPTAPAALQHAWCDRCRRAAPPVAGGNAGQRVARRRVCTGGAQATP